MRRLLWLLLPALALVALLLPFGAIAGAPPCQTKNVRTGVEYKGASPLSTAITAANAGDTINVWGTCVGNFAVGVDITLQGKGKNATLDGNQQGRVLRINGGTTTIKDLTITNGRTTSLGGGIYVTPTRAAVLVNVLVTGNTAGTNNFGGGIEADENSSLTLINSTVSGNSAGSSGGIDMFSAKATLIRSSVTGNHATRAPGPQTDSGCEFGGAIYACAGGIWNYLGTLALVDSTVSGNTAAYRGGGVVSYTDGTTTGSGLTILSGATVIKSNSASNSGGGIFVNNSIAASGLGVHAADGTATYKDPISGATLPAWTGAVSGNTPDQCSPTLTIGTTNCGS